MMMGITRKHSWRGAFLIGLLAITGPALADICTVDQKPGATVLIPYFEVDLDGGVNTRFWVRNTATRPTLARVQLWSNVSVPVFGFDIYLPAYGTQRIDLGALLRNGTMPSSGPGVTPIGSFDSVGTQINYPQCNAGTNPNSGSPIYATLGASDQNDIRARLTGNMSPNTGACYGYSHGDNVARGYVTVDVTNNCTSPLDSPNDPGYFIDGSNGTAGNSNVLLGGFELIDPLNNFAAGAAAPVLETTDEFFPGSPTFYGQQLAYLASDGREPLPGAWQVAFNGDGDNTADLLIWRATPPTQPFACGTTPQWFPLGTTERVPFDTDGDTPTLPLIPPPLNPITGSAVRFPVSMIDTTLNEPSPLHGSALINMATTFISSFIGPEGNSWVGVLHYSEGRFSELTQAQALDDGCDTYIAPVQADTTGPIVNNPTTPSYIFIDGAEGP